MPIYEYRCEEGHTFEAFQSMSEDPLTSCEVCGAPASRVLSAPAIHYKGSGFYTTDYARKGAKKAAEGGEKDSSGESKGSAPEKKASSSESKASGEKATTSSGGSSSGGSSSGGSAPD